MRERDQESRLRYIAEKAHVQAQYFANHSVKSDEILGRKYLEEIQFLLSTIAALRKRVADAERARTADRNRINMLRVTLATTATMARDGKLSMAASVLKSIGDNARHALDRDTARSKLLDGELAEKNDKP